MKHCTKTVYFVTNVYACCIPACSRACYVCVYACVRVCVWVSCKEVYGHVASVSFTLRTIFLSSKLTGKVLRLDRVVVVLVVVVMVVGRGVSRI